LSVLPRRGSVVVRARLADGMRPDTVFVPFHWARVHDLTNPRLAPTSGMPEFKTCAVTVAAVQARRTVPDRTVPDHTVPDRTVPDHTVSDHPGPDDEENLR
jgi:formylmethanofuran dehydrogenase subunit D